MANCSAKEARNISSSSTRRTRFVLGILYLPDIGNAPNSIPFPGTGVCREHDNKKDRRSEPSYACESTDSIRTSCGTRRRGFPPRCAGPYNRYGRGKGPNRVGGDRKLPRLARPCP